MHLSMHLQACTVRHLHTHTPNPSPIAKRLSLMCLCNVKIYWLMSFSFNEPLSLQYQDKWARKHTAWKRKTNRVQILQTNREANDRWPESDSLNLLWRQSKVTCVYFEWVGDYTRIVYPKVGLHTSCCVSSLDQENEAPLEDNNRQHFSFTAGEKRGAWPGTRKARSPV